MLLILEARGELPLLRQLEQRCSRAGHRGSCLPSKLLPAEAFTSFLILNAWSLLAYVSQGSRPMATRISAGVEAFCIASFGKAPALWRPPTFLGSASGTVNLRWKAAATVQKHMCKMCWITLLTITLRQQGLVSQKARRYPLFPTTATT